MYAEVSLDPVSPIGLGAFASTVPADPPPVFQADERERLRAAARKAEALYPGAVGRHLRTDFESWATVGLRFDSKGILAAAVAEILRAPLPEPPAAAAAA